jgi:hypothetical protein
MKIGIIGSCQLHLCSDIFFSEEVCFANNITICFSIPFYLYDKKYYEYTKELDYSIFDTINVLIIENNNLTNKASSEKIIQYCRAKEIRIIRTCLLKCPIFPINWSGYGERTIDYENWKPLHEIDYNIKLNQILRSMREDLKATNLNIKLFHFIKNNFNKIHLFNHSLHPTNVLLYELWRDILEKFKINIDQYKFDLDGEQIINDWFNPFTTKMVQDLNIQFDVNVDDQFYIKRYETNKEKVLKI